ncbi:MAG: phosphatidylglycerophosphatase A family protein [Pyrinomonadaceae bacterium]
MPGYDELIHISATVEAQKLAKEKVKEKTLLDYFSLALTTCGVGYLPLMPGTYGSIVGVAVYLLFWLVETNLGISFLHRGWNAEQITAWIHAVNVIIFLVFCLVGVWASGRATRLFQDKDPQKVVVDEVIGQLLVFMFIPFAVHWYYAVAGFLLFRLFDIWKPYPIDSLQNLPAGIGVCADDILAGIYGGACLALLYAVRISF